eukprot:5144262-Prymnesium_polylepis.1
MSRSAAAPGVKLSSEGKKELGMLLEEKLTIHEVGRRRRRAHGKVDKSGQVTNILWGGIRGIEKRLMSVSVASNVDVKFDRIRNIDVGCRNPRLGCVVDHCICDDLFVHEFDVLFDYEADHSEHGVYACCTKHTRVGRRNTLAWGALSTVGLLIVSIVLSSLQTISKERSVSMFVFALIIVLNAVFNDAIFYSSSVFITH